MDGLYVERRTLDSTSLSRDIAYHLYARQLTGKVVVVTARPSVFMASISKQWSAVARLVERQRACTMNARRRQELQDALTHMRATRFLTSDNGPDNGGAMSVLFMTQEACIASRPGCHTMYVTDAEAAPVDDMVSGMAEHSLVVLYFSY